MNDGGNSGLRASEDGIALAVDNGAQAVHFNSGFSFRPSADNDVSLGRSPNRWKAVYAANGNIQTSDMRYKGAASHGSAMLSADFISALEPISFVWKDDEKSEVRLGFSAQQVKEVLTDFGQEKTGLWQQSEEANADGVYLQSLNYDQLIAPLVAAVKELKQENADLRQRLDVLERHMTN